MPTVVKPSPLQVLLLPFWPPFWGQAARWSWGPVIAMFLLTTMASTTLVGLWSGVTVRASLADEAAKWDSSWDPIVVEDGVLRVEGPRIYASPDGRMLVDPEDRLDLDAVMGRSVVFRREEVVQIREFDRRVYRYTNLLSLVDARSVRVDGASLQAFTDTWGIPIVGGILLLVAVGFGGVYALFGVVVALAAAGLLSLWPSPSRPPFAARARVTLAICTLAPPLWALFTATGIGSSCCIDLCVGPPVVAALGWLALRGRAAEE